MEKLFKNKFILPILLTFATLLLLAANVRRILYNCFHAIDFSIYQQAIYDIATNGIHNPYLTVRNIKIFSDHFDPVLIFASPFAALFSYHPASLIVFEWLWYFALLIGIIWIKRKSSYDEIFFYLFMAIFCRAFLSGLNYPIHPTTWTIFSAFLIALSIKKNNAIAIILSSTFFCFFKEIFPASIIFLGAYYLFIKRWRLGIILLIVSCGVAYFDYILRPQFFSGTYSYNEIVLGAKNQSLIDKIWQTFLSYNYLDTFKTYYPFIIPLALVWKYELKNNKNWLKHPSIPIFICFIPLLGIHYLSGLLIFHRTTTLAAFLLCALIFSNLYTNIKHSNKWLIICTLPFLLNTSGLYTKFFAAVFLNKSSSCTITPDKNEATQKLLELRNTISKDKTILATGGVIPRFLTPNMKIYVAGIFSAPQENYGYILFEREGSGDVWPYSRKQIENYIPLCEKGSKILLKNYYYFLAEGPFTQECTNAIHSKAMP